MTPISREKRELIIKHKESKKKEAEIAVWLDVSTRSVRRIWKLYRTIGDISSRMENSGRKAKISSETTLKIIAKIEEQPDITLLEMIDEFSLDISESGLSKMLKKLGFTFKKRRFIQKNKSVQTSRKSENLGEKINNI
jgi:transposase